ncbi:kynurenine formamidase [Thalassobacillus devorans]|uniref:Kynurenine formamidase n=1 Tax=Thalassobacillus devorans TaxID=279813 RepID=A0ABQ1PU88_9BACI|nr:arylformamidase [Thalassobacillus devorans]NIK29512.1 arylformamidase [Thalassobacillus devorans]GGD04130.1 kynurenine formamidase [Thalassobacillus devorans]
MKIIDISMTLDKTTPPWPGDERYNYSLTWSMQETGAVNVGSIKMSNHTGTHVDAPFHYASAGLKIADLPLERFHGIALVVDVSGKKTVEAKDLQDTDLTGISKLILQTKSWQDRSEFPPSYTVLGEDLGSFLKANGIDLVGVDTPSVDPETSKELKAHHSLHKNDVLILEGLVLDHVKAGIYELNAFPLKMTEADGSPVRAVLKQI